MDCFVRDILIATEQFAITCYKLNFSVAICNYILLLKSQGMEKINFSGGEPFIKNKGNYVGQLVRYCKQELHLPSVTIVSNGSLITEEWFQEYGM